MRTPLNKYLNKSQVMRINDYINLNIKEEQIIILMANDFFDFDKNQLEDAKKFISYLIYLNNKNISRENALEKYVQKMREKGFYPPEITKEERIKEEIALAETIIELDLKKEQEEVKTEDDETMTPTLEVEETELANDTALDDVSILELDDGALFKLDDLEENDQTIAFEEKYSAFQNEFKDILSDQNETITNSINVEFGDIFELDEIDNDTQTLIDLGDEGEFVLDDETQTILNNINEESIGINNTFNESIIYDEVEKEELAMNDLVEYKGKEYTVFGFKKKIDSSLDLILIDEENNQINIDIKKVRKI